MAWSMISFVSYLIIFLSFFIRSVHQIVDVSNARIQRPRAAFTENEP